MKRITSMLIALIAGVAFTGTSLAQDGTLKKIKDTPTKTDWDRVK